MNNLELTPDPGHLGSDLPSTSSAGSMDSDLPSSPNPGNVSSGLRLIPDISKLFQVDPMSRQYESALARIVRQFCRLRDEIIETEASLDAFTLRRVSWVDEF